MKLAITAIALCCVPVICAPVVASAQVRDLARPKVGTGSIAGVVMSADAPDKPLRRVTVMLGAGEQVKAPTNTVTDDAGRFSFDGLPLGTYTLVATRPGFVTVTYGSKTSGRGMGAPISIADGQKVSGLVLKMMHGAAITGTVHLPNGQPAVNAEVALIEVRTTGSDRRLIPVLASVRSDDRGVYRLFGLAPGNYFVRVDAGANTRFDTVSTRVISKDELDWARKLQSGTAATSAAPGSTALAPSTAPSEPQPVKYSPVYFPGVTDPTAATMVTVGANEERSGVDVAAVLVPTATITGRILDASGSPAAGAQVRLESATSSGSPVEDFVAKFGGALNIRSNNGEFTAANVPPGHYHIIAKGRPPAPAGAAPARAAADSPLNFMGLFGGGANQMTMWADAEIDVNGHDVGGVVLQLRDGLSVKGKVVFETSKPEPPDVSKVRIGFSDAEAPNTGSALSSVGALMSATFGVTEKDGSFVVAGLMPGRFRSVFVPPNMMMPPPLMPVQPGGFVLKSAISNGKDIADSPINLQPGSEITDLVVTFTDVVTELSGKLQDASGNGVGSYPIVVFSTDRQHWAFGSRRIAQARPANDGSYKITGLPPGEYYMCALTDLDANDLYESTFLEGLSAAAFKITITDGEKKVENLKLGGSSPFILN